MKFKDLSESDKDLIVKVYKESDSRKVAQKTLSNKFDVSRRSIRTWSARLGQGQLAKNIVNPSNIMVYDIETSRVTFKAFWTGKQFVGHKQVKSDPTIISICWKWLGDDKIESLTWDKDHSDKGMMESFLKEYNKADMVIGQNNDNFDNRWINARAMKHNLKVNTYVKSFDIMKQNKKFARVISYSLDYNTKYCDVAFKQSHEGILMWDMVEDGTPAQQKEYLKKMVDYNEGDIISTEELYLRNRKYYGHKVHFGMLHGDKDSKKWSCPNCGSEGVNKCSRTATPAGTIQIVMDCGSCEVPYKISNRLYSNFMDYKYNEL